MPLSTGVFLNEKWTRPHRHRPERGSPRHFHGLQPSLPFFSSHVGATARTKSHHTLSRNPVSSPDPKSRFPLMLRCCPFRPICPAPGPSSLALSLTLPPLTLFGHRQTVPAATCLGSAQTLHSAELTPFAQARICLNRNEGI